ncbi:MAG: helix-turn-helix domain-containing protein [Nitratireductor sp.]
MQHSYSTDNRCLRTSDAGAYVGLSKSTLEKLRVTGGGPEYAALGRVVVYRIEDLDAWVSARKRRSTSDNSSEAA